MANLEETLAGAINKITGKDEPLQDIVIDAYADSLNTPVAHVIAAPNDVQTIDLTEQVDRLATKLQPWRRTGTAQLSDLGSLIDWANRHKGDSSALFAETGAQPRLTCIADYLGAGAPVMDHHSRDPKASHMRHRAVYPFPLSPEWKAWTAISGEALEGAEMGEFVEAHAADLLDPTPAMLAGGEVEGWEADMMEVAHKLQGRFGQYQDLLRLARNFQVNEVSNVTATMNRDSGESSLQFLNEHQEPDGSPVSVPTLFMILIPVFEHGAAYRIPLRFRYRKAGARVKFFFSLHNADIYLRDAIDHALAEAVEKTNLPLFRGTPEIAQR